MEVRRNEEGASSALRDPAVTIGTPWRKNVAQKRHMPQTRRGPRRPTLGGEPRFGVVGLRRGRGIFDALSTHVREKQRKQQEPTGNEQNG